MHLAITTLTLSSEALGLNASVATDIEVQRHPLPTLIRRFAPDTPLNEQVFYPTDRFPRMCEIGRRESAIMWRACRLQLPSQDLERDLGIVIVAGHFVLAVREKYPQFADLVASAPQKFNPTKSMGGGDYFFSLRDSRARAVTSPADEAGSETLIVYAYRTGESPRHMLERFIKYIKGRGAKLD